MLKDKVTKPGTHVRDIPEGWTARAWIAECERRANTAAAYYPKVAATYRRWAGELRAEHAGAIGKLKQIVEEPDETPIHSITTTG